MCYIAMTTYNIAFDVPGAYFFVFNVYVSLLVKLKVKESMENMREPEHLILLDIILASCITLNLLGILDYWWLNGEIEKNYNLAFSGLINFTILELLVLYGLSKHGISNHIRAGFNYLFCGVRDFQSHSRNLGYIKK